MKRIVLIVVAVLLSIGLLATLNDSEYIGLTGLLDKLSTVDFSFSDTTNLLMETFEQFERVFDSSFAGGEEKFWEKAVLFFESIWDMLTVPFVAIAELIGLLRDIGDLLFSLVGVF